MLSQKRSIKSVCCNVSHRKQVFSCTKWKQKLQAETATAARSIYFNVTDTLSRYTHTHTHMRACIHTHTHTHAHTHAHTHTHSKSLMCRDCGTYMTLMCGFSLCVKSQIFQCTFCKKTQKNRLNLDCCSKG